MTISNITDMASRKNLKKNVSCIIDELLNECIIRCNCIPGTDTDAASKIIGELIELDADFTSRISHTEPGMAKVFYRQFRNDFNKQIEDIISRIEALSK